MFVGVTGFEPATTRPPDEYSNRAELHPALKLRKRKIINSFWIVQIYFVISLLLKIKENKQVYAIYHTQPIYNKGENQYSVL